MKPKEKKRPRRNTPVAVAKNPGGASGSGSQVGSEMVAAETQVAEFLAKWDAFFQTQAAQWEACRLEQLQFMGEQQQDQVQQVDSSPKTVDSSDDNIAKEEIKSDVEEMKEEQEAASEAKDVVKEELPSLDELLASMKGEEEEEADEQ